MSNIYKQTFRGNEVVGFMSHDNFKLLDRLIREHDIKSAIELGTFVGLLTCWLAERLDDVIGVDNFDVYSQDFPHYIQPMHQAAADNQYATFLRNTLPYPNIRGIKMDFMEAVELPLEADLIYIDAVQPSYPEIVRAWLPKARKVIAGDDLYAPSVKEAVREIGGEGIEQHSRSWWKVL